MLNLKNLSKSSIFTQAYIFFKLKKALEKTFEENYPNLLENLKISQINIQKKEVQFILIICSQNLGFLTWLKIQENEITELLLAKLSRDSFWESQKSSLKFKFEVLKK